MSGSLGRFLWGALLVVALPVSSGASGLTLSLPEDLVGGPDMDGWEQFSARAAIGSQEIAYILYVDPRYPALYRLTRYQITVVTRTPEGRVVRSVEDEKLVWNSRPGVREPLRCYSLPRSSTEQSHWQLVPSDSEGYRSALHTVVSLYKHTQTRLERAIP